MQINIVSLLLALHSVSTNIYSENSRFENLVVSKTIGVIFENFNGKWAAVLNFSQKYIAERAYCGAPITEVLKPSASQNDKNFVEGAMKYM